MDDKREIMTRLSVSLHGDYGNDIVDIDAHASYLSVMADSCLLYTSDAADE